MSTALEANYRTQLKRAEELAGLRSQVDWLKSIPVKELVSRGAIEASTDKAVLLDRVLGFFGVSSVAAWRLEWKSPHAVFRRSQTTGGNSGSVTTWLRLGEMQSRRMKCGDY